MPAANHPITSTHGFTVSVPGTCANLGPGFDSFGLAIDWDNHFHFSPAAPSIQDAIISNHTDIPLTPADNLVFQAMDHIFQAQQKARPPFRLEIDACLPSARGLGSSSTAIVAGLVAANHVLENPYTPLELAQMANRLEGHPDNVAPALLGGVKLCDDDTFVNLPWPDDWKILLLIPPYPIKTEAARRVLPEHPSRKDAIFNLRKASLLTYALLKADGDAFARSLDDALHQPYRGQLIPEWREVQNLAKQQNAFGSIISGSGSVMAVFYSAAAEVALIKAFTPFQSRNITLRKAAISVDGARLTCFD
ncbi:MAG: homoserine kinase [Vampirovibrionales bacterium]|nr:homoserine kinase [Vampirovibrionales bacterium]